MELIVFAFSVDLSAENSNLSAVSGNQRNQLFGCMPDSGGNTGSGDCGDDDPLFVGRPGQGGEQKSSALHDNLYELHSHSVFGICHLEYWV